MIEHIVDIDKIIGNMLVKQSTLARDNILNVDSIRGVDLSKFITDKVKLSYDLSDLVILFEVKGVDNENVNVSETMSNDLILESSSFEIQLTIYGNQSLHLAKILKARIESEKVRNDLLAEGLYLINIESIQSFNEFMNETVWPRADIILNVACEMQINQVDTMNEVDDVNVKVER